MSVVSRRGGRESGIVPDSRTETETGNVSAVANPAAPTWRRGVDEFAEGDYKILNREEIDWSLVSLEWAVPNLLLMWERIRTLEAELSELEKSESFQVIQKLEAIARAEKAEARVRELEAILKETTMELNKI